MQNKIDIQRISDIMCPWYLVGLGNLTKALAQRDNELTAHITLYPVALNPDMPQEAKDFDEYI